MRRKIFAFILNMRCGAKIALQVNRFTKHKSVINVNLSKRATSVAMNGDGGGEDGGDGDDEGENKGGGACGTAFDGKPKLEWSVTLSPVHLLTRSHSWSVGRSVYYIEIV